MITVDYTIRQGYTIIPMGTKNQKTSRQGFAPVLIVVILGVALAVIVLFLLYRNQFFGNFNPQKYSQSSDWKIYTSGEYGFSIDHPNDWLVEENDTGGGR